MKCCTQNTNITKVLHLTLSVFYTTLRNLKVIIAADFHGILHVIRYDTVNLRALES